MVINQTNFLILSARQKKKSELTFDFNYDTVGFEILLNM